MFSTVLVVPPPHCVQGHCVRGRDIEWVYLNSEHCAGAGGMLVHLYVRVCVSVCVSSVIVSSCALAHLFECTLRKLPSERLCFPGHYNPTPFLNSLMNGSMDSHECTHVAWAEVRIMFPGTAAYMCRECLHACDSEITNWSASANYTNIYLSYPLPATLYYTKTCLSKFN